MQTVPAHAVPAGPLGVRWRAYELEPLEAGAVGHAQVELENAGAAAAAAATRRSPSRLSARHCSRRSSRTARSRASPPGNRTGAGSPGSTTAGSQLDCDPVVDPSERPSADTERNHSRDREVDHVS